MLPPEIFDKIFSSLVTDKASLEACSNAHPAILLLVERYLYADVAVDLNGGSQTQELLTLLSEKPHISNYTRHLKISSYPHSFVAIPNTISTILHLLARLTSITWVHQSRMRRISWNELPESFLTAFMMCLRLPSMEVVSFTNIRSFPLSILPNTKIIRLINMGVRSYPGSDTPTHPPLQVLSVLDCEGEELRRISSWAKTRHVHALELRPEHPLDFGKGVIPLLQACSNSLTGLDLDLKHYFQTTYIPRTDQTLNHFVIIPLYLAGFNNLERLTVHALATVYDADRSSTNEAYYSWSLPAIVRLLKSATSSLKHITLHFHIYIHGLTLLPELDWSPFELYYSPSPMLQHIELRVSATAVRQDIPPAAVLSSLSQNRCLKGLVERGLLAIEPHIELLHRVLPLHLCNP